MRLHSNYSAVAVWLQLWTLQLGCGCSSLIRNLWSYGPAAVVYLRLYSYNHAALWFIHTKCGTSWMRLFWGTWGYLLLPVFRAVWASTSISSCWQIPILGRWCEGGYVCGECVGWRWLSYGSVNVKFPRWGFIFTLVLSMMDSMGSASLRIWSSGSRTFWYGLVASNQHLKITATSLCYVQQ